MRKYIAPSGGEDKPEDCEWYAVCLGNFDIVVYYLQIGFNIDVAIVICNIKCKRDEYNVNIG